MKSPRIRLLGRVTGVPVYLVDGEKIRNEADGERIEFTSGGHGYVYPHFIPKGEIWIDDKLVNDVPAKDRNIAMVFQNYALYPHMTVFENMAFALICLDLP